MNFRRGLKKPSLATPHVNKKIIIMDEERKKQSFSIDIVLECVRGLSALWVFIFHIADAFEISSPLIFTIARYGYQGVPVFFVISGYCIYSAAEKTLSKGQRPNTFLLRRLIRVLPPFWASIILLTALPFLLEAISSIKTGMYIHPSPRWFQFTGAEWLEIATLTRDFFSDDNDLNRGFSPINAVYWSLAIEIQLYFAMYIALYFKENWRKFLTALLGVSILFCLIPTLNINGLFLKFWPAFFFGLLLRWMHQQEITPSVMFGKTQILVSSFGSGILVFSIGFFMFHPLRMALFSSQLLQNAQFIAASAIATVLLWLLGGIEHGIFQLRNFQSEKSMLSNLLFLPLFWLGQSSYSLYLLHGKLYQLPSMFIRQIVSPESVFHSLLTVISTAILCFVFYKLVEVPFQRIGRTITSRVPGIPVGYKPLNAQDI